LNLYLNGQPLNDEQILANYGLINQSAIDLDFGLVGGKVHGSLARAGKVKGQTPKVCFISIVLKLEIYYKILDIENFR